MSLTFQAILGLAMGAVVICFFEFVVQKQIDRVIRGHLSSKEE
jgi:hypothetical protein